MRHILSSLLLSAALTAASLCAATPEETLAKSLEQFANEDKPDEINALFDAPLFFKRLHGDITGDDLAWNGFETACLKKPFFGQYYCKQAQDGQLKFLRVVPGEKQSRAIFRYYDSTGLNHVELLIEPRPDGPRIIDQQTLSNSELLSEEKRVAYLRYLVQRMPKEWNAIVTKSPILKEFIGANSAASAMHQALDARDYQGVLKAYDALPEDVKRNKSILLLRLNASTWLKEADWTKAIADYKKNFPNDPQIEIRMIDVYLRQKNVDAALKAIDFYDHAVGGDPLLDMMRSNAYFEAGRFNEALPFSKRVVEAEPKLSATHSSLLYCQIALKDYDAAIKTVAAIDSLKTGFNVDGFAADKSADQFRASPQYQTWLKSRDKK